jgi:hypothetical protein
MGGQHTAAGASVDNQARTGGRMVGIAAGRRSWLAALALACAPGGTELPDFDGPGRLLLIVERGDARELVVIGEDGSRVIPGHAPREARFLARESLLVIEEVPAREEFALPDTQMIVVDLASGAREPLGPRGRHFDPAPSPDRRLLAVGAETPGIGDSDLEIWALAGERERVAARHQSLEEPRWRHDGGALVASVLVADPETDDDAGGGMLGTSFSWPRLHRLGRDLGDPVFVWDGDDPDSLAPGGSLPLWWDASGIFARQRRGLVRCDPLAGGCTRVFETSGARRVVDGCRVGEAEAWLLTVEAIDAFDRRQPDEIARVSLPDGRLLSRWHAPEGVAIAEIDWIGDAEAGSP